jgi:hypothetical protein
VNVKQLKKREAKAWERRQKYDRSLRDVYDFVLPMRDVSGLQTSGRAGRTEGASRVDKIFDATAVKAAFRFAGRLQTELTPIFQNFFSLEAGPLVPDGDEKSALTKELQRIGGIVGGVLSSGEFHNASHEMYLDLYAGTGAMLVLEGDDIDLLHIQVVPIPEIALEQGPRGKITGVYWKRKWLAEHFTQMWPKGNFSETIKRLINDKSDVEIEVCQYTYYQPESKNYRLVVWTDRCEPEAAPLWTEEFRTNPWITPRFFKVPGEVYGAGYAQIGMAFVKTLNKAQELALHAAAFALSGLWMYRKDNVFNPDTARFEPRAMWPVSSTGGPMGPAIQRLPVPQDFDISTIIIQDQREQAKQALGDDGLPADTAAVRSATEVAERIARLSQDLSGVYGRLTLEIVVPLVQRAVDVLERKGVLETSLSIDQLITQVRVVAPIAIGQMASKIKAHVDTLQMSTMLAGPEATNMAFKLDDILTEIGRWMGMEERFITTKAEREKAKQAQAQMAAAQQASEIMKNMPQGDPAAQLVNGAAA